MHWIQKHILRQLSVHDARRYIELKPPDVDGNLFMYHIQQLQKNGYVSKNAKAYVLSDPGKLFVSRMSLAQGAPLMQPRIVVMLICQNENGEYLLFRWCRQPNYGLVSFPFSKLHFGRTIAITLDEALWYKANLKGNFTHVGNVYLRVLSDKGEVSDHTLVHLHRVTDYKGQLGTDSLTGQPFWGQPRDVPTTEFVPGFTEILQLVESGDRHFLHEITLEPSSSARS